MPKSARMKYIILPAKMPALSRMLHKTGKTAAQGAPGKEQKGAGR